MKINKDKLIGGQIALKDKYNVDDDKVVVVESKARVVANIGIEILRILIYTILLALAFVGLISILIPDTRDILLKQAVSLIDEFLNLFGGW